MRSKFNRFVIKLLRIKPDDLFGMSYDSLVNKQDAELKAYQEICPHTLVTKEYYPLIVCLECKKALRKMTPEEIDSYYAQSIWGQN